MLHLTFDFLYSHFSAIARAAPTVFTSALSGAGILRFVQLHLRNRRLKVRTVALAKLCALVAGRPREPIHISPVTVNILKGTNAYHVTVPGPEPVRFTTTVCIRSRQTLPEGQYFLDCRLDSVVFTLLEDDRKTPTAFAVAMFTAKRAEQ